MFNISIANATPAYADIMVTIAVENLEAGSPYVINHTEPKYGAEVLTSNKNMLILDRSNPFIAGDLQFMMERSIAIYRSSDDDSTFIVKYISTEEPTTTFQKLDSLFIRNNISRTDGKEYLSFIVRAYQYRRNEVIKQLSSASFLDTKIHTFEFNDQFVASRLYYKKGTIAKEEIELRYSNIPSTNTLDVMNKFAYYSLSSENSVQVKFSSAAGDFVPTANSTLYMDLYTTKGAAGNIEYTGDVIIRLQEEEMRNLPIYAIFFNSKSIGGVDRPSLNKIKNAIINEISTRDVIVTENDLNNYFLILTALLETVNDGKITFIKKRDDILRRIFSSYILMRDGLQNGATAESGYLSKVLPTNTLDASFDLSTNVSKPFGTVIERNPDDTSQYQYVEDPSSDNYYIIPFYTRITLSPFKKVKYIYNLADMTTSLSYRTVGNNSGSKYFVPSTVSVYRGMEGIATSNYYSFKFIYITNFNLKNEIIKESNKFSLSFYRRGTETVAIKTMNFNIDDNVSISSIEDEDNAGIFETTIELKVFLNDTADEFIFDSNQETEYGTNIVVLDPEGTPVFLPSEVKLVLKFNNITNDSINMDFISSGYLTLFKNLDELMYSDITINESEPGWNEITTFKSDSGNPVHPTIDATSFSHYIDETDGSL
jgi:hypothetical protein